MEHVIQDLSNGPVVIVHRGWRKTQAASSATNNAETFKQEAEDEEDLSEILSNAPVLSKLGKSSSKGLKPKVSARSSANKTFEFVNATTSYKNKDPAVRKRVRAHVMRDFKGSRARQQSNQASRGKIGQRSKSTPDPDLHDRELGKSQTSPERGSNASPFMSQSPTGFAATFPLNMEPRTYRLLARYFATVPRVIPLELYGRKKDVAIEWFHIAMADDASFHAMLFTVGVYLSMVGGEEELAEARRHLHLALTLLSKRLSSPELEVSNSTISAVCCLATAAVSSCPVMERENL